MDGGPATIRILHVDDDSAFGDLSATALEETDDCFDVQTATSAEAGLEALATETIDCVVSDYKMPGTDGIELLEQVRETHPELPFILFTGEGSERIASEAISAGTTDYLQKQAGTEQFVLLANRITNAVEAYHARRRATRQERITSLLRNINRQLVSAETAEAVEQTVCEAITESESYLFAWIGEPDTETGEIHPRTSAGNADEYLKQVEIRHDGGIHAEGPGGRAVRTTETQVVQQIPDDPSFEPWRETAAQYGYESVIVLPLLVDGDDYGILSIYADQRWAFDANEQTILEELAETVCEALAAVATKDELEATNTVLRTMLENLTDGVLVEDDERRILMANEAFCSLLDIDATPEELVGRDCRAVAAEASDIFANPESFTSDLDELLERRERDQNTPIKLADGRTLERDYVPYEHPKGAASLWIYRDVSDRADRQRALEILQQRTETLMHTPTEQETAQVAVNTAHDVLGIELSGVNLLTEKGDVLEPIAFVDTVRKELGEPPAYVRGDDSDLASQLVWEVFEAGEPRVIDDVREYERLAEQTPTRSAIVHPLDDYGVFILSSTAVDDFDETDKILADVLATALTAALDRVERERTLRRQNDRLEQLASVVSHDLRNPLNVIGLRLELAQEESGSDHLEAMARAHERMNDLLEDLLTLAREGNRTAELEAVDLATLIDDCWHTVETGSATLICDATGTIRADRSRVQQLVENLLGNAVEHGGENVTVTVGDLPGGFYFEDDGAGIPDDERAAVFDAGYTTRDGGSGIGLSIVSDVAETHGWSVTVTASDDGGARFEITGVEFEDE